jgi:hypothetical protein
MKRQLAVSGQPNYEKCGLDSKRLWEKRSEMNVETRLAAFQVNEFSQTPTHSPLQDDSGDIH